MSRDATTKKYDDLVAECDLLIKAGELSVVSSRISKLNLARVPRASRQSLAKICRRAGLVSHGLRLLQPIIRNEKPELGPASSGEICEYSVLLSRNGSVHEALSLLEAVDGTKTPEALLYLGYCHISNWDYAKAVGFLEGFLGSRADDYSKLVARVNLASSYLATSKLMQAEDLLLETIPIAQRAGSSRLAGNCFELLGHVHFQSGDFSRARATLDRARVIFGNVESYDQLLIQKTLAIMASFEEKSVEPLARFREVAIGRRHWECVREADLFTVKIRFDQNSVDHLVFGTPMPAFRERIKQELGADPSSTYVFGTDGKSVLDIETGHMQGAAELKPGGKIHRTIAALIKDFYVPRNSGALFSELFPNEYFDINSSPHRVEQLLWRTRKWLSESNIGASIEQSHRAYRFVVQSSFGIRIPLEGQPVEPLLMKWNELVKTFGLGSSFTAEQACTRLGWSRSSFLRVADWAQKGDQLRKSGTGKSTVYLVRPAGSWPGIAAA